MVLPAETVQHAVWRTPVIELVEDWSPSRTPVLWAWWSETAEFLWPILERNRIIGGRFRAAHPGDALPNEVSAFAEERAAKLSDDQVVAIVREVYGLANGVEFQTAKQGSKMSTRDYLNVQASGLFARLVYALVEIHTTSRNTETEEGAAGGR